jgi:N-acetylglucosaminylphosphatidylinositol deacetylase
MRTHWDRLTVADAVATAVESTGSDLVLSFDAGGVSGHLNHKCVHAGVCEYARRQQQATKRAAVYTLETVTAMRKFSSVFDFIMSWALHAVWQQQHGGGSGEGSAYFPRRVLLTQPSLGLVHRAMLAHGSQYVWYRRFFVFVSRYALVNSLRREG